MEEKNNVAEILKDKPEGTKLWTDMFGSVTLYLVTGVCDAFQVKHHNKEPWFDKDGKLYKEGVLCIYPSKSMRDWSKFAWKPGDVLVNKDGSVHIIFDGFEDDTYKNFHGKNYLWEEGGSIVNIEEYEGYMQTSDFNKANKEDAQEYIHKIEKELGGKLNMETLEIENPQPEFKDGDIVLVESNMLGINTSSMIAIFRKEKENDKYKFSPALCESNVHDTYLRESPVVLSPSDIKTFRLATDSEKQQLFDALAKYEKAWDAEKKEVVGLKPKVELKPFDKVLVRDSKSDNWRANLFGYIGKDGYYRCVYANWAYCIPYIGNEHLLGTTKDVEG